MSNFIENQKWRYATKKYDTSKKVSTKDLDTLKEAIQLSISSYGLQPYKVFIVENPELRLKLQVAAWGQSQIVDASHLFVFANQLNVGDIEIDSYMNTISKIRNVSIDSLSGFSSYIKGTVNQMTEEAKNIWTSKQTYLALGNLINAAAELKIDATPMEGFVPSQVNEILGLNKMGLNASLLATIGYRHEEDKTQQNIKVRKSKEELFITL